MALPELKQWKTESVRATFISHEPISADASAWWKAFTGEEPDTIISKPNSGMQSVSGPFGTGNLEMRITFNRVDWLHTPVMTPIQSIPYLGEAEGAFSFFSSSLERWINETKSIPFSRIAYSPVFSIPVNNINDGNTIINNYFNSTKINTHGIQDLFIQMNIPKKLSVCEDLIFNRIGKFMSGTAQVMTFGTDSPIPVIKEQFFCRTELDFNTDASRQAVIPSKERFLILEEMAHSTTNLISTGWADD